MEVDTNEEVNDEDDANSYSNKSIDKDDQPPLISEIMAIIDVDNELVAEDGDEDEDEESEVNDLQARFDQFLLSLNNHISSRSTLIEKERHDRQPEVAVDNIGPSKRVLNR